MSIEAMKQARDFIAAMSVYTPTIHDEEGMAICNALDQSIAEAEMMQAAAQGREIKLAMAEANDRRLEAEKKEPVAYVHADELEELSHCNGMSVWAENALAHTDDSLSKQLLPSGYVALYTSPQPKRDPLTVRVWGWVWKDKRHEGDLYVPSYTPANHVPRGELLALVDPADLHNPLDNTTWHTPEAAHGIKGQA